MTIKKGDTLYRISSGEPMRVAKTRKLADGLTRLYIVCLDSDYTQDEADVDEAGAFVRRTSHGLRPARTQYYTPTQTPELAQLWADTLKERAQWEAEREAERLFRLANRDALNAPEVVGEPVADELRVLVGVQSVALGRDRLSLETREHTHQVSIFNTAVQVVDETGEFTHPRAYLVNWSALGNQSPAVARAYAHAILAAADLAESIPTPTED
jgi:hypothetical protein